MKKCNICNEYNTHVEDIVYCAYCGGEYCPDCYETFLRDTYGLNKSYYNYQCCLDHSMCDQSKRLEFMEFNQIVNPGYCPICTGHIPM